MSSDNRSGAEQIGKVFAARRHGLRECLVCGELFPRKAAAEHADVNCYRLELGLELAP